jgi:hypothetical protein
MSPSRIRRQRVPGSAVPHDRSRLTSDISADESYQAIALARFPASEYFGDVSLVGAVALEAPCARLRTVSASTDSA